MFGKVWWKCWYLMGKQKILVQRIGTAYRFHAGQHVKDSDNARFRKSSFILSKLRIAEIYSFSYFIFVHFIDGSLWCIHILLVLQELVDEQYLYFFWCFYSFHLCLSWLNFSTYYLLFIIRSWINVAVAAYTYHMCVCKKYTYIISIF